MQRMIVAVVILAAACGGGSAKEAAHNGAVTQDQRSVVEDTLRKLVDASIAAQNRGDMNFLRTLYAPSALSIQGGTVVRDMNALFATFDSASKSMGNSLPKITAKVERIDVLSPSAAVVTTTSKSTIDSAGKELSWGHVYTGVFHNTGDGWQVVQEHVSMAPPE